jgi:flavorubredoxin
VAASGLTFRLIAPDHGPIWRKDIGGIVESYGRWAAQKPTGKAVVVYGTMWQNTEKMARAISEGLSKGGLHVKLMSMSEVHRSDVMYELLDAGALVVGSSTLNNNMLPIVADVMTYMRGLKPKNLIGAAFGSFGWSGEAVKQIEEILAEMKIEGAGEGIRVKNAPDGETLTRCYDLGLTIAEKVKARL